MVMIKSTPDTPEAKQALSLARHLAADVILIQNAVYLALPGQNESLRGPAYALDEDLRMRGIAPEKNIGAVKRIDYDVLVDLLATADGVHGAF